MLAGIFSINLQATLDPFLFFFWQNDFFFSFIFHFGLMINKIRGITICPDLIAIHPTNIFNFQKCPSPHCIGESYLCCISGGAKKKLYNRSIISLCKGVQKNHNKNIISLCICQGIVFLLYIFFHPHLIQWKHDFVRPNIHVKMWFYFGKGFV